MGHMYFVRHGQTVWNVEKKICGSTRNSRTWGSAQLGQKSCPTFPQKRSGGEPANLRFRFQDSSLRIILALSAAGCHRSLEG